MKIKLTGPSSDYSCFWKRELADLSLMEEITDCSVAGYPSSRAIVQNINIFVVCNFT